MLLPFYLIFHQHNRDSQVQVQVQVQVQCGDASSCLARECVSQWDECHWLREKIASATEIARAGYRCDSYPGVPSR